MTPVFGIFYNRSQAERSVERLRALTFHKGEVSILIPSDFGSKDLSHDRNAKAGNSTAVVVIAVAVGGILGLLIGLGIQSLPEMGASLPASPLLGALVGFGIGGLVGGAIDAVDAAGPPDPDARRYEGQIEEGGILVTVHCETPTSVTDAQQLLRQTGAQSVTVADEPATTNSNR